MHTFADFFSDLVSTKSSSKTAAVGWLMFLKSLNKTEKKKKNCVVHLLRTGYVQLCLMHHYFVLR